MVVGGGTIWYQKHGRTEGPTDDAEAAGSLEVASQTTFQSLGQLQSGSSECFWDELMAMPANAETRANTSVIEVWMVGRNDVEGAGKN